MAEYTTVTGDTWDIIALKVYGQEKYADVLMQNNHKLLDYTVFESGVVVNCPDLDYSVDEELPLWRQ